MLLKITGFDGLQPAADSRVLAANKATVALNTRLVNGTLRSWKVPKYILTLPKIGEIQTVYRFGQDQTDENNFWFHWTQDVDVVRGPVADNNTERTYWTGEVYPMYAYFPMATQGAILPAAAFRLGIPKPETSPVATAGALPPLDPVEASKPVEVASVTRYDATTAEVTLKEPTDFDIAAKTTVIVSGATPPQYNGSYDVTWLNNITFHVTASQPVDSGGEQASTETLEITNIQRIDANTAQIALAKISDFIRTKPTTIGVVGCTVAQYNGTFNANWINETVVQYTPTREQTVTLTNNLGGPLGPDVPWTMARLDEFTVAISLYQATRFDLASTARIIVQNVVTPSMLNGSYDATWIDSQNLRFTTTTGIPNIPIGGPEVAPGITLTITAPALVDLPVSPAPSGVSAVTLKGSVSTELPVGSEVTGITQVYLSGMAVPEDTRDKEARNYVVTFVSPLGEEGPPCLASNILEIVDKQSVSLTSLPLPPNGQGWNLPTNATKRIYRSATSGTSAVYLFVDEVPIAQTTYSDDKEAGALNEAMPSQNWNPPPADLVGLCMLANGVACGFRKNTNEVWFSEPFLPHAWPNMVALDFRVVGVGAFGTSVFAGTVGSPYILTGIDPSQMTAQKIPVEQSCVSKRSVVEIGGGVAFASPDGLCLADGSGIKVLTAELMLPDQWRAYNPSSMFIAAHENRLFMFYKRADLSRGALVFDLSGGAALWESDTLATAAYTDVSRDAMYFVDDSRQLQKWDYGDTSLTYDWRSKVNELPFPSNFACAQVLADSYPVTLNVAHGNTLAEVDADTSFVVTVNDDRPFRMPGGFRARYWQVRVTGSGTVYTVLLANTMEELARA